MRVLMLGDRRVRRSTRVQDGTCGEATTAKYYDSIAPVYDSQIDAVEDNRVARSLFLTRVSSLVRPGGRIVDFGCGTGVDCVWYADHGHPVIAYDISNGMTDMLRRRCAEHIASGRVTVIVGTQQNLWDFIERSGRVDAIVANFAVFNHIRDLAALFHALAAHLVPGGIVVTQMLNPLHLGDVRRLWWWRSAARSLGSGAVVFSGRDTTTYRHFARSVVRAAAAAKLRVTDRLSSAQIVRRVVASRRLDAFGSQFSIFTFQRHE